MDPGIIIAVIGAVAAVAVAWYRTRSDKEAGLLEQYRLELIRLRADILELKLELTRLRDIITSDYSKIRGEYDTIVSVLKDENKRLNAEINKLERN